MFDLYFRYCHNQPYSLFHEGLLRDRYKEESLPDYLILSISAYALRFSHRALYGERTDEVMTRCAMAAWSKIVILWNSCKDGETDLHMIQSLHLLSIIDFTGKFATDPFCLRDSPLANFTKTAKCAVPGLRLE